MIDLCNEEIIEFKKKKWKIINRSKVIKENEVIDHFIVALSKNKALSYLESNMAETYHIDNWLTFHTKFWNSWLKK